jgi:hypothetical protein
MRLSANICRPTLQTYTKSLCDSLLGKPFSMEFSIVWHDWPLLSQGRPLSIRPGGVPCTSLHKCFISYIIGTTSLGNKFIHSVSVVMYFVKQLSHSKGGRAIGS